MTQAKKILDEIPDFITTMIADLKNLGLDVTAFEIDHVCCRVRTSSEYERLKQEFLAWGRIISEAVIAGRPIATFRLDHPISVGDRKIPCIEIPAPKPGKDYEFGLEHCEFVIQESFEAFTKRLPELPWNWGGARKRLNAELALSLDSKRSVKFHHLSLEEVIRIEDAEAASQKS